MQAVFIPLKFTQPQSPNEGTLARNGVPDAIFWSIGRLLAEAAG